MNYYIADLHIGHKNIIRFDKRPFANADEMDKSITENWNSRIQPDDTVYILGDFIWHKENEWASYVKPLAGKKVLIRGNHDPKQFSPATARLFEEITDFKEIKDYSTKQHKLQITHSNSFFTEKFGRNDFEELKEEEIRNGNALEYLTKYLNKTNEKIIYSRGIPTEIYKFIEDKDIATTMFDFVTKYVLFDDVIDCKRDVMHFKWKQATLFDSMHMRL